MKYYNEDEQSWRKLKQDHPDVAKAIEESDKREFMDPADGTWAKDYDADVAGEGFIYRAPIPEPVKLDTRRVAGWFAIREGWGQFVSCDQCSVSGISIWISEEEVFINSSSMSSYLFSKDPMKPLDQWQTLEQVCAEAQA